MEIVHPYFKDIFLTILKPMPLPQFNDDNIYLFNQAL